MDKIDALLFYINGVPYLDSNISSNVYDASIGSEILHIARKATDLVNLVTRVNLLLIQRKKQDSECTRINPLLKKMFGKHFIISL